mmetsp:Transcript_4361/g.9801  ORF Transcript_4361/g.9801 Transcript_4361/m.9801 type:complete len:267 (-) Transcript_4361:4167-4967(-)
MVGSFTPLRLFCEAETAIGRSCPAGVRLTFLVSGLGALMSRRGDSPGELCLELREELFRDNLFCEVARPRRASSMGAAPVLPETTEPLAVCCASSCAVSASATSAAASTGAASAAEFSSLSLSAFSIKSVSLSRCASLTTWGTCILAKDILVLPSISPASSSSAILGYSEEPSIVIAGGSGGSGPLPAAPPLVTLTFSNHCASVGVSLMSLAHAGGGICRCFWGCTSGGRNSSLDWFFIFPSREMAIRLATAPSSMASLTSEFRFL